MNDETFCDDLQGFLTALWAGPFHLHIFEKRSREFMNRHLSCS
ncbi:hypothetical protein BN4901_2806 [Citrobacter europaeus]|uniref:Uncharacterized protein n=1 Tax=Citrobacter europaeus TaxID=1914243 RepID=A0ABY0JQL5_9ENTR|nr:hypothetical protein BN4901_2806 [Citrobacter europaeus]